MLKYFSTFTGVGSFEMALRNVGIEFELVGMSEVDKWALLAYDSIHNNQDIKIKIPSKDKILEEIKEKNILYNFSTNKSEIPRNLEKLQRVYIAHKRNKNWGDIRLIDETKLPDFDLFTYSFPCKNVSISGQQAGLIKNSGTQSSLLWECERIIEYKNPSYLIMENVKNLVGKAHIKQLELWIEILRKLGYNSYWKVLNGKDFRVSQNRERVMMVSIKKGLDNKGFEFPDKQKLNVRLKDLMQNGEYIDESLYIKRERYEHIIKNIPHQNYKGINKLIQVGNLDKKIHSNTRVYDEDGLCPTLNSMNGGNRQPKILLKSRTTIDDTQGFDKDADGNKIPRIYNDYSPSLIATRNELKVLTNEFRVRKLTALECWRLMGFLDEDFYKAKDIGKLPNTKLYERAGRGIIVPMLEDIFKQMIKFGYMDRI